MNTVEMKKEMRELISEKFEEEKVVPPTIFSWVRDNMIIMPVEHLMNNKDIISALIDKMRMMSEFVCFTSEAWMVVRSSEEEAKSVSPSECPDRAEKVILYFYEPLGMEMWMADIDREGEEPKMGKWLKSEFECMKGRFANPSPTEPSMN